MTKIQSLITKVAIKADAQGNAPVSIELLRTGDWHTPWHGDFEITMADLHEFAANFVKGIGLVEADKRAPINYAHEAWDKAAGWITGLSIDEARQALVASVEWTPEGAKGVREKEWAYISPEFNPRGCPWSDAEGLEDSDGVPVFVNNVLSGAGLTNIPLFKKLKPVTASRLPSKTVKAAATGDSEKHNEGDHMTLEEIRAKEVADLTAEEKAFLVDNKADLTAEELTKYELGDTSEADAKAAADKEAADKVAADEAAAKAAADEATAKAEADKIEASAKPVSITASQLAKLEADATAGREASQKLAKAEAKAVVSASVNAGQIKSSDAERWTNTLLASQGTQRTEIEALLKGLPVNASLNQEIGDDGAPVAADASAELDIRVNAAIKASEGKLTYSAAVKEVLASDKEFRDRVDAERNQ